MISQLDVVLYLESFRNIDVYLQGLYYLRITVPEACLYYSDYVSTAKKWHNLIPPQSLDSSYTTKVFLLKYAEEVVKICETVIFRFETDPLLSEIPPLTLQVELYFTDINGDLSPGSIQNFLVSPQPAPSFKLVSQVKYTIHADFSGVNQMVFITFLDNFSSSLAATVHVFATNYKALGDYAEKIFPRLCQWVTDSEVDQAYDTYLLPLGLGYNKLAKIMPNEKLLSLPLTSHSEQESDFILKTLNRVLFSKCLESRDRYEVAEGIFIEIQEMAAFIQKLKHDFLMFLKEKPEFVVRKLMKEYITLMDDRWGENVVREVIYDKIPAVSDMKAYNEDIDAAKKLKSSSHFANLQYFQVCDDTVFSSGEENTILFESIYAKERYQSQELQKEISNFSQRSRHLIILVHGYLGSYNDVKMLQDTISNIYPKGLFLLSRANEGRTDGRILEMGQRLAEEIKEFIRSYSSVDIDKISFIGHSLGGLIIRSSLPYLSDLSSKCYSYISLACPHLGCKNNENIFIDAGLWVLCKITQSQVLNELSLKDQRDIKATFIYALSKMQGLGWFKKVYFFSSSQDRYVPFHSARAEANPGSDSADLEMVSNILDQIKGSFHRINTIFNINTMEVSNLIGRSAHVMFLDNIQFLNILVFKYIL